MYFSKFRITPSVFGCVACILLIVSFCFSNYLRGSVGIQAVNTILVISVMCIIIHLVRTTSALNNSHVWNDTPLVMLWVIPVFNLFILALQFFGGIISEIFSGYFFTVIMILLSTPVFFCLYFLYVSVKLFNNKILNIISVISSVTTVFYVCFRIADKIIFPLIIARGDTVNNIILKTVSLNTDFTLILYILYFFGFILLTNLLNKTKNTIDNHE